MDQGDKVLALDGKLVLDDKLVLDGKGLVHMELEDDKVNQLR